MTFGVNGNGLSTLYKKRERLELFEEIPDIQGHPAVIEGIADTRENGDCGLDVGMTDDLVLGTYVQLGLDHPSHSEPCSVARKLAEQAIKTIKGAQ